jgi:hypothetical protein
MHPGPVRKAQLALFEFAFLAEAIVQSNGDFSESQRYTKGKTVIILPIQRSEILPLAQDERRTARGNLLRE